MSDIRIDSGAEAATRSDADPGDGQGLATPGAHPGGATGGATGGSGSAPTPEPQRSRTPESGGDEPADSDTEGERFIRATEANRASDPPPGSGLDPDDVPDDGPDATRAGEDASDAHRPSTADIPANAAGSGSSDPTTRGGSGSASDSDLSHPLG